MLMTLGSRLYRIPCGGAVKTGSLSGELYTAVYCKVSSFVSPDLLYIGLTICPYGHRASACMYGQMLTL